MAATIYSLVSDAKRNRLSLIGPLTEDDVLGVWEKVARFVEALMLRQKGVSITGLGTFTFSKRKIDVGNNKAIVIQRPVFVLSERFIQTHSLRCVKQHTSGQVPLHVLNFTQLSNETGVNRELVEGAVREVLQALSRAVAAKKSIEFDLKDVGRLTIHDGRAKMSFFREFILRLDGNSELECVFRTSTAGSSICSIMTNPHSLSRPSTTLSLPKIIQPLEMEGAGLNLSLGCSEGDFSADTSLSPHTSTSFSDADPSSSVSYDSTRLSTRLEKGTPRMSTISEEADEEREGETNKEDGYHYEMGVCTVDGNGKLSLSMPDKMPPLVDEATCTANSPKSPHVSQQRLIPKPAVLIVGGETGSHSSAPAYPPSQMSRRCSSNQSGVREGSLRATRGAQNRTANEGGQTAGDGTRTKTTSKTAQSRTATSSNKHITITTSGSCSCSLCPSVSRPSTCSHQSSTGQELCYLCHQRALKNVPIDLSKERAALEKWTSDTLQEYQRRSELLSMARTQADKTKRRLINQDTATFNQSRADNIKKQKEVKSSEVDPSYVFCDRALTPGPYLAQQRYCRELDSQVEVKHSRRVRERETEEKMGREEQERLTKDLAAYEELYRRMKAQTVEEYKSALNEQVALKCARHDSGKHCMASSPPLSPRSSSRSLKVPTPNVLSPFVCMQKPNTHREGCTKMTRLKPIETTPTSPAPQRTSQQQQQQPVFGVHKVSNEVCERERAKAFFLEQLAGVEEKQRREEEKALQSLREDADMLRKTREGLRDDLRKERSRRVLARQGLEEEWLASVRDKQRRLLEDLHRAREHGIRLHQQCEKYHRCKQCQRKRENAGKSNILHETRYISGSRLMV